VKQGNKKGYITFAKTGAPNSRSTQVFISLKDNDFLDSQGFSAFGRVIEGMSVVESFYNGYGEQTTNLQDRITNEGKAFLDKNFPKLDSIKTARIVPAAPAAPAAAKTDVKKSPPPPPPTKK
jgi:cyclophilin family peptidyl-prolyl cis-trans isomerase